ncbi:glycosyltransferase family 4 protein [Candidatus Parcubacteria bacterium]|nr:glycosyltransferase family 4 protein [Patescibacteria group bacterium]MBU4309551.1 glycosyltransferase family 4 protein [Patescibacteria group bacterium]MBU4432337.1 glycosyltransferase family 4 protein [Patescibacteria group bacterium]MBU4578061.1 glycosyltransferase family 4 protein [Patescibacteria group bacterium]MCG2696431.1 glycosyltransferase family 4 protein [Candidatus Parcubacteria bacterium]
MQILIINSYYNIKPLFPIFEELSNKDHSLCFLSHDSRLIKLALEKKYPAQKIRAHQQPATLLAILLIVFLPLTLVYGFFAILYYKLKKKTNTIIYFNWFEKIIYTIPAKLLKIKNIWLFLPETETNNLNIGLQKIIKLSSQLATVIVFNQKTKDKINKLISLKSVIKVIPLGIKNNHERQENIFEELSKAEHAEGAKKYFTIGTAVELNKNQNIEMLFHAIEKCISVLPNLQLIIIGDGEERKTLSWLAKKMNIENITWFVGEQKFPRKWLDNFDIFVSTSRELHLADIEITLTAMKANLPIIGFWNTGIDDLISTNNNGKIIEKEDSELLADEIINLYKHKVLCHKLGEAAKFQVDKNYNLDTMVDTLLAVLK